MEEKVKQIESYLRDFITPIISQAVEKALSRHQISQPESPQPSIPELMDIKATALYLQLSVPTIYSYVSNRSIPHCKVGKRLYFRRDELLEWIASHRRMTVDEIQAAALESLAGRRRR